MGWFAVDIIAIHQVYMAVLYLKFSRIQKEEGAFSFNI